MSADATVAGLEPAAAAAGAAAEEPRRSDAADAAVHIRIRPSSGWVSLRLAELWEYRELLFFLAWRDVKVRYKQTVLGASWAVLVPLLTMIVFNVLFGLLMGRDGKPTVPGVPYAISTYAALVPWQMFAFVMSQASNSIVNNRNMITKIYFPRLIAPLAPVLSALVDFTIAFAVLVLLILAYHFATDFTFVASWRLLLLPLFVLVAALTALGLAMWLSALNAIYRDVKYAVPFMVQMLMFVSPVVYTTSSVLSDRVPEWVQLVYALNPLVGVLEGFRWALFATAHLSFAMFGVSIVMVMVLLVSGMFYFRRMERVFADYA